MLPILSSSLHESIQYLHCVSTLLFSKTFSSALGSDITLETILEFVDKGHNVVMAGDSDASSLMRDIAAGVGIKFDAAGTSLYDHFNYNLNMGNVRP